MHDNTTPMMPKSVDDHEGSMARSELYRAAKYSMKLFQMIEEGQDLEGWVQAKITKSADYLDSVYHYMEYQMKFGGGSNAASIDDITDEADIDITKPDSVSDMDDEEELDNKKVDESMMTYEEKLQALLEGKVQEAKIEKSGVRASDKKKGKVDKSERKQYFVKLEKDNKTKGMTIVADEGERESELRDRVKRDNIGWTVASIRVKDEIDEAAEKISKAEKTAKNKKEKDAMIKEALTQVVEKAVSKAQQKAAGVALAAKKSGKQPTGKGASAEMAKMDTKELKKFAGTKHKGLPEKKDKKVDESGFPPSPPDGATAAPKKDPKTGKYPKVTSGPNKGKEWSEKNPGPTNPDFKEDLQSGTSGAQAVRHYSAAIKKLLKVKDSNPKLADEWRAYAAERDKYDQISSRGLEGSATQDGEKAMELLKKYGIPIQDPQQPSMMDKAVSGVKGALGFKEERDLVRSIVRKVVAEKKAKPDFLDVDKDGDKKEPMKKAVADKKAGPTKGVNPFAKKDEKKESVNESADLARMKQFLTRLNG